MADSIVTKQALIDAQKDAQALEEVINGEPGKLIKTRLGRLVYTLASVPQINTMTREEVTSALAPKADKAETAAALDTKANQADTFLKTEVADLVAPKADKTYVDTALVGFTNGASKWYATLALAEADIANITIKDKVDIGEIANGGTWYKATAGATTLTKSAYDPLTQAKADATTKANAAEANAKKAISDYTIQKTQSTKNKFEGDESFKFGVPYSGYVASYYIDVPVTEGQKVVLSNGVLKLPSNAAYLTDTGEKTGAVSRSQITANKYGGAFAHLYNAAPSTAVKLRLVWLAPDYNFDRSMFQLEVIPVGSVAKPSSYEPPKRFQDYILKFDHQLNVENIKTLPEAVINSNNYYDPYTIVGPYLPGGAILSNLIPTVEGDKWYMQRPATASSYWFHFYDSNLVQLAGVLYPYATAPVGAAFVCGVLAVTGTDSAEIQAFNSSPAASVQIEKSTVPTPIFPRYKLSQVAYLNNVLEVNNLKGKHLYALGDSITQANAWLGATNMLGMTYKNFAISGGQWTVDNHIATQIDNAEAWINAGNRLPDIIGIALGTNDWGNSRPIGDLAAVMAMSETDSDVVNHSTVLAAIKYAIIRLRKLVPNAFIFMITPLQRSGKYDYTYIQAVKDGARMMSVPCMDSYAESGMNAYDPNTLTKYFSDGLHTTNAGNKKYSGYVAKKLCQIYAVDQV